MPMKSVEFMVLLKLIPNVYMNSSSKFSSQKAQGLQGGFVVVVFCHSFKNPNGTEIFFNNFVLKT